MDLNSFENIIFDLGNVVINLDLKATEKALQSLFNSQYDKAIKKLERKEIFNDYEKGNISTNEFISEIQSFNPALNKADIVDAWNAMLKDIPPKRFEILKKLKSNYRIFCLSNTNELHISWILDYLNKVFNLDSLDPFFEKVYYSHQIGMRKPDQEIFDYVVNQNSLAPEKTLFIDDTKGHLEGAAKLGIKTFHMQSPYSMELLFQEY